VTKCNSLCDPLSIQIKCLWLEWRVYTYIREIYEHYILILHCEKLLLDNGTKNSDKADSEITLTLHLSPTKCSTTKMSLFDCWDIVAVAAQRSQCCVKVETTSQHEVCKSDDDEDNSANYTPPNLRSTIESSAKRQIQSQPSPPLQVLHASTLRCSPHTLMDSRQ
jgi:hypothetical protein